MKKKIYQQPDTEVILVSPFQLMGASRGWSQDGNPPIDVTQEDPVVPPPTPPDPWGGGDDDEYDDFLDLD